MDKANVHEELFKGANQTFKPANYRKRARTQHNRDRTEEENMKRVKRLAEKKKQKMKKLLEMGIDFS